MASEPSVSVVIPTYNNERTIGGCLSSIENQSHPAVNAIVVDSYSTDRTPEICKNHAATLIQKEAGRAKARNIGAAKVASEYIYHVDSDMVLSDDVVRRCVDACESSNIDGVIVPERNVGDGYWAQCLEMQKWRARQEKSGFLRFLPTHIYHEIGGHDPNLVSGEDRDVHRKFIEAGYKVGYVDELVYHDIGAPSLMDVLRMRQTYASSLPRYLQKYDEMKDLDSEPFQESVSTKNMLQSHPLHAPGYLLITLFTVILNKYHLSRATM